MRTGLPVAPAAAWRLPLPTEVEVFLPPLPAAGRSGAPPAAPALSEAGTILVTDLAPLPSLPGMEAQNEAVLAAPLPTLLPQTNSQAERERVLGFDPRGFSFANPGPLLPAPVVPLSVALAPATPAVQAPRMASAVPVGAPLGGLPPPPNFGLDAPTPPPLPAGTPQTTAAPPDGDGVPEPAGTPALPAAAIANAAAPLPTASAFPIMPVEPVALATGTPPAASLPPTQAAPAATEVPAAPPEPTGDGKTAAAADPKTPPSAKPDVAPNEAGKAGEGANKIGKEDPNGDKPAPSMPAVTPLTAARPDDKAKPEKSSAPAVAIPVLLTRRAAATDANGPTRYQGAFTVPREGDYHLRLTKGKGAKVLVDGALVKTTLRLKAGRHRVEVQMPHRTDETAATLPPPVLEVTPAAP